MDYKVKGDMMFSILKGLIINQNKELLKKIAEKYSLNYEKLEKEYIKPAYYLPIISEPSNK